MAERKAVKKPSLKRAVFRFITLIPLLSILGVLLYFEFLTNGGRAQTHGSTTAGISVVAAGFAPLRAMEPGA